MGLSKDELIKKLEAISSLYKRAMSVKMKMNDFEAEDNYERKVEVPKFPLEVNNEYDEGVFNILVDDVDHTADDAKEHMSKCYDAAYQPKEPTQQEPPKKPEKDTSRVDEHKNKKGCISLVACFVIVCSLISGGLFSGDLLTIILNIVIIAVCVIAILAFFKKKKECETADAAATEALIEEHEQIIIELQKKYEQDMEEYQSQMDSYKLLKAGFLEEYVAWRKIYLKSIAEEDEIEEQLEKDRQAAVEKIEKEEFTPVLNELTELNDLVTNEYLPAIDIIIDLLKSGRADDMKEAINLYEDILYKERQLQFEREKEEQRQREEELRRQEEERRYQEQKAFREEQERQRRYEEERQRRDEEEQARIDAREREAEARHREYQEKERLRREKLEEDRERREQEYKQSRAAQMQCQNCAHVARCSMKMSNAAPNCTGFTPRR